MTNIPGFSPLNTNNKVTELWKNGAHDRGQWVLSLSTCFFHSRMILQENWASGLFSHRRSLSSRIPACPALPVLACLSQAARLRGQGEGGRAELQTLATRELPLPSLPYPGFWVEQVKAEILVPAQVLGGKQFNNLSHLRLPPGPTTFSAKPKWLNYLNR